MGKAWKIFCRDLGRILRNPVALVVTLGICVVPCLYAWINVVANWDPYENTSTVPVAVVNDDEPATTASTGIVCAGDMIVDALRENDQIGWTFVGTEDDAIEGVRAGTYYAAIVIPADFTHTLTGVLDGNRDKAHLTYYVNEKVNAVAPKVTDTGASTIENQINEKFMAIVSKVAVEKVQDAASGAIDDSRTTVDDASGALDDLTTSIGDVNGQLDELIASLATTEDALGKAAGDLGSMEGTGARTAKIVGDALAEVGSTRVRVNGAVGDLNRALGDGVSTTSSLLSQASSDVAAVAGTVSFAQGQVEAAVSELERSLTDTEDLSSKVANIRSATLSIAPAGSDTASLTTSIGRELDVQAGALVQLSQEQAAKLDELRTLMRDVGNAADDVARLSRTLSSGLDDANDTLANAQASLGGDTSAQLSSAIDSFVQVAQQLQAGLGMVDPVVDQASSVTRQLADTVATTRTALERTREGLGRVEDTVVSLASELGVLRASASWERMGELLAVSPEGVRDFMSSPVELTKKRLFPVDNYGSGIAPFFTSVALWVGGIALVAIYKLEVDDEGVGDVRPWQAYFGRWLLFVLLGALQAVACCTGNLVIGIQCAHPWALYLSAVVASFAFVNIIFALSVAFKHIGKALAFTLIILQVPGSAGMYPIEMMPRFFQAIGPWLPFTYSNNAMREAIAGLYDGNLARDLGALLLYVVPAILVGVGARTRLVNVNALFDLRLRQTDHLLVSEPVAVETDDTWRAVVVRALRELWGEERAGELERRRQAFGRWYPRLVRAGILSLFAVPLALFVAMLVVDAKLVLLACWIVSLVVIYAGLIVMEYAHYRLELKDGETDEAQG